MKKGKVILLVILILIAIGAVIGYRMWNKPHTKVEDVAGVEVSVNELTSAFETDEAAANEKYLNKAIVVKGTVSSSETNQDGKLVIYLVGDNSSSDVQCTMRDENENAEDGNTVTVKGFCTGSSLFGVLLTDCVIVQ